MMFFDVIKQKALNLIRGYSDLSQSSREVQEGTSEARRSLGGAWARPNNKNQPRVILGLSGGPDSVFLFHVLVSLRNEGHITFVAAHLDHEWRENSSQDALFCAHLCIQHDVPVVVARASGLDASFKYNGSVEEKGRRLRRYFLEKTAQKYNATCIMLAHHLQDQQETFVLRLVRGTTLNGLHGMNECEGLYVRPLLSVSKSDILNYVNSQQLQYVVDPTNNSDKFLRNKIRSTVIPALHECDARFNEKFLTTINLLKEEDDFVQRCALRAFERIFSFDKNNPAFVGNLSELKDLELVIARRVVLLWLTKECVPYSPSTAYIDEIMRFVNSDCGGSHEIAPGVFVQKKQRSCWIEKDQTKNQPIVPVHKMCNELEM